MIFYLRRNFIHEYTLTHTCVLDTTCLFVLLLFFLSWWRVSR
jgi:hypothetical protein